MGNQKKGAPPSRVEARRLAGEIRVIDHNEEVATKRAIGPIKTDPINRELPSLARDVGNANRELGYRRIYLFTNDLLLDTGNSVLAFDLVSGKSRFATLQINVCAAREPF